MAMVGHGIAGEFRVDQQSIQLNRWLDGLGDDHITLSTRQVETDKRGNGARRGNGGLLKPLQPGKLPDRRTAPEKTPEKIAIIPNWIELQKVCFAVLFKAPHLAVPAVFDQRAHLRQIAKGLFQVVGRH